MRFPNFSLIFVLAFITFSATGVGATPTAVVSVTSWPYLGTISAGTKKDFSFILSNPSRASATSLNVSGLANGFAFTGGTYPGTGGTCGSTLSASASCTVALTFSPTSGGMSSSPVTIAYYNGASTIQIFRTISGSAGVALVRTNLTALNFPQVGLGLPRDMTLYLVNASHATDATSLSEGSPALAAAFRFKGGTFPGTGGTCGSSLGAGTNCKVVITFAPTAPGAVSGVVNFSYFDGYSTQTLSANLSGTGAAPANVSPVNPSFSYLVTGVGASTSAKIVFLNSGDSPATSLGATFSGPFGFTGGSFPGTGGNCTNQLNAKLRCSIAISFAPTSPIEYAGSVTISYNNGAQVSPSTSAESLSGVGKSAVGGITLLGGETITMPDTAVGGVLSASLSVKNNGTGTVGFSASSNFTGVFSFPGGFPGTGGTCSTRTRLTKGATCVLTVAFSPVAATSYSGSLSLMYDAVVSGPVQTSTKGLQGRGFTPAFISFSAPVTFSSTKTNSPASSIVTVTNGGAGPATSLAFSSISAPFSQTNDCPSSLSAGGTCHVTYTYTPASAGSHSTTSVVSYYNGANSVTLSENLSGTATASAWLSASATDYGFARVGSPADRSITITNQRDASASAISVGSTGGPFAYKGGTYPGTGGNCGSSLAAGAHCTVVITYTPLTEDLNTATWTLTYNDGSAPATLNLPLSGTGATGLAQGDDFGISNDGSFSTVAITGSSPYTVLAQFYNSAHELITTSTVTSLVARPAVYLVRSRVSGHSAIMMFYQYDVRLAIYDSAGNPTSGLKSWLGVNNGYSPSFDISDTGTVAISWSSLSNWGFYTYLVSATGSTTDMSGGLVNTGSCYISAGIAFNKSTGEGVATCQGYNFNPLAFRRFNANGTWRGAQTFIGDSSSSSSEDSHYVAMNDSGQFVIVQQSIGGARWWATFFNASAVEVARIDLGSTGSAVTDGVAMVHVRVATIGNDFILPWKDDSRNGIYFGHYRRVHPDGTIVSYDSPASNGMNSIQIDGSNNVYYLNSGFVKLNEFSIH